MPDTDENGCGLWPTPNAAKAGNDVGLKCSGDGRAKPNKLGWAVGLWPTPRSGKTTDETEEAWTARRDAGKVSTPPLTLAVKMWPTPRASANENRQTKPTPSQLAGTHGKSLAAEAGGSLNPMWVEWLMGYPLGWTDLKDSATPSCRKSPPR